MTEHEHIDSTDRGVRRRGARSLAAAAAGSLLLVLALGAGSASAAVTVTKLFQGDSSVASNEDYVFTAGDTIVPTGTVDSGRSYKIVVKDAAGTTRNPGFPCTATASFGTTDNSYTVQAGDPVSTSSDWSFQIQEWTNLNCTGTLSTATKGLDVAKASTFADSGLASAKTLFRAGDSTFTSVAGLPQGAKDFTTTWLDPSGAVACENNAGGDRPDSSAGGALPDVAPAYLQYPPTSLGTVWNLESNYETKPALGGHCAQFDGTNDGNWHLKLTQSGAGAATHYVTLPAFTVDTTAPAVTLTTPANNSMLNTATPALSGAAGSYAGAIPAAADSDTVTIKIYSGTDTTGTLVRTIPVSRGGTGSWSVSDWTGITPLPEGTYTAQAEQSDGAGNLGHSGTATFLVDRTAPPVTVAHPTAGQALPSATPGFDGAAGNSGLTTTASPDDSAITVTVRDQLGSVVRTFSVAKTGDQWSLPASAWSSGSPTSLASGTYTVEASQSDDAGNSTTTSPVTFKVDTTAPGVSISSPADQANTNDTTPAFSGGAGNVASSDTSSADSGNVTVKIYAGSTATGGVQRQLTVSRSGSSWSIAHSDWTGQAQDALGQGVYTARAEQSDGATNLGQSSPVTFRVDTDAPSSTTDSPALTNATSFDVTYTDGDVGASQSGVASVQLYAKGPSDSSFAAVSGALATSPAASGSFSYTPSEGDGNYCFATVATDRAGNSEQAPPTAAKHCTRYDHTAPTVTLAGPSTPGKDATPAMSGSAGAATGAGTPAADNASVEIDVWSGTGTSGPADRTFTVTRSSTSWSLGDGDWSDAAALTAHLADGTWTAIAKQSDALGNTGTSAPATFKVDTHAPVVGLSAPSLTGDSTPALSGSAGSADGSAADSVADGTSVEIDIWSGTGTSGSPQRVLSVSRSGGSWTLADGDWADANSLKQHLGDGTWTAVAVQTDAVGNSGQSSPATFKVDTTAPAVTMSAPASVTSDTTPNLTGGAGSADGTGAAASADDAQVTVQLWHSTSAGGTADRTLTATRSGSSWTLSNTAYSTGAQAPLGEGDWTARALQSDAASNTGTSTPDRHFVVDTTDPAVTVSLAPSGADGAGGWYLAQPAVTVAASDAHISSLGCEVDGSAVTLTGQSSDSTHRSGTVPVSGDGSHTVTCTSLDAAANSGSDTKDFKIDTTDPSTTVTLSPSSPDGEGGWYLSTPSVSVSTSDAHIASLACEVDGSAVTLTGQSSDSTHRSGTVPVSGDASHSISCTGTDDGGNTGSDTKDFKVDSTQPVTAISVTPSSADGQNGYYLAMPAVSVSSSDAHIASLACEVDGSAVTLTGTSSDSTHRSGTVPVSGDGSHSVSCTGTDGAGNEGSDSASFKVDSHAPSSHASSPANTNTTPITVTYTASDTGSAGLDRVELWAKGPGETDYSHVSGDSTPSAGAGEFHYAPAGDGTYRFYTIAVDAAGNREAAPAIADDVTQVTSTALDRVAPQPAIASPAAAAIVGSAQPVASGDAGTASGDDGHVDATLYAGSGFTGTVVDTAAPAVGSGGAWQYTPAPALAEGTYTLRVVQHDAAGNAASDSRTFTVDLTDPDVAIAISPPAPNGSAGYYVSAPALHASASDDHLSSLACRIDGTPVALANATADATQRAGDLPPAGDGNHTVTCTATDDGGRTASASKSFKLDRQAPSIASSTDGRTVTQGDAATASYGCSDETGGSGVASCTAPVADGGALDTTGTGAHSFTVTARDSAGNTRTRTVSYTVVAPQVVPGQDATPPGASFAGPLSVTLNRGGLPLSFTCSEDCTYSASGTLTLPGSARVYRLKPAKGSAKAGKRVRILLKLDARAVKAVRRALKKHIKATTKVTLTVTDGSGNKRLVNRSIRIKKA